VENQVKRFQRGYIVPIPQVSDLEDLNKILLKGCEKDLEKKGANGLSRRQMLAEEMKLFIKLPSEVFEACTARSTFADSKSIVRFDNNSYSIPQEYSGHRITVKGFADQVKIYAEGELIASHARSYEKGEYVLDYMHYIRILKTKPGAIYNGIPFKNDPWGKVLARMREELEYRYGYKGTKKFIQILLLIPERGLKAVSGAVKKCIRMGAFDDEAVRAALSYTPRIERGELDLTHRPELMSVGQGKRDMAIYDELIEKEY
jgi:hypothetical protein